MSIKTYSELMKLRTFDERFRYLRLNGAVGKDTFGFDRYMNQIFYRSPEWKAVRHQVIVRDNGCDLGMEGYEIHGPILIHHMNPIAPSDIKDSTEFLLNPEYLICTVLATHNAIHYGSTGVEDRVNRIPIERTKYDTCPWKR